MPNRTISLPDDVVPIIDRLGVPFSRWVADQLRLHDAQSGASLVDQLLADAALAGEPSGGERRLTKADARAIGARMERSAKW
jgi:hypothetical protein